MKNEIRNIIELHFIHKKGYKIIDYRKLVTSLYNGFLKQWFDSNSNQIRMKDPAHHEISLLKHCLLVPKRVFGSVFFRFVFLLFFFYFPISDIFTWLCPWEKDKQLTLTQKRFYILQALVITPGQEQKGRTCCEKYQ